jgi:hypothetical protein
LSCGESTAHDRGFRAATFIDLAQVNSLQATISMAVGALLGDTFEKVLKKGDSIPFTP